MEIINFLNYQKQDLNFLFKNKFFNTYIKSNKCKELMDLLIQNNLGFILLDNDKFVLCMDIGCFFKQELNLEINKFLKIEKNVLSGYLKYLHSEIYCVCPTTYLFFSNIDFNDWLENNSLIKTVMDAHPNYNFITISSDDIKKEDICKSNDKRIINIIIPNISDGEKSIYDYIEKNNTAVPGVYFYQISRFPKLLKAYDDYRYKKIPIILPIDNPLEQNPLYKGTAIKIKLDGFTHISDNNNNIYFTSKMGSSCTANLYMNVDFDSFFKMETKLDLFHVFEAFKILDYEEDFIQPLFFFSYDAKKEYIYPEEKQENTIDSVSDDLMVADIYTTIPVRYDSLDILEQYKSKENNFIVNNIITGLRFQENYEFGNENHNVRKYQDRIVRYDLGTINVLIAGEVHYNYYKKTKVILENDTPIPLRIIIAADVDTHTAMLYLINLGCKGRPSVYLDEISRNCILVDIDNEANRLQLNDEILSKSRIREALESDKEFIDSSPTSRKSKINYINLYSYLNHKFHIKKMGTPRHLILSPYLGDEDPNITSNPRYHNAYTQIKASLLYAETLYDDSEELGKIIDENITNNLNSKYGQAVYDYSSIYMSKVCVLQYGDTYKDYTAERIDFAVVNLFYFELLSLEDAAIQIATNSISKFINGYHIKGTRKNRDSIKTFSSDVLETLDSIEEEYAKTLDFWDIQMNYHSSKIALNSMREKFEISKAVEQLKRTKSEIEQIYQSRKQRLSRRSGLILSITGALLTVTKVIEIFVNEHKLENSHLFKFEEWLIGTFSVLDLLRVIAIIIILYYILGYVLTMIFSKKHRK